MLAPFLVQAFLAKNYQLDDAFLCAMSSMSSKAERTGKTQTRSKRRKGKNADRLVESESSQSMFFSYSWLPDLHFNSCCRKVVIGLALTGLNVVLLFHNLDAFESHSVHELVPMNQLQVETPSERRTFPPQPQPAPNLRGRKVVVSMVSTSHGALEGAEPSTPAPPKVKNLISLALAQNSTQMVKFRSESWPLSIMTLSPGQQLPYAERYSGINLTFGEYLGHDNTVLLSPCGCKGIHELDIPFSDFLKEKAAFRYVKCSEKEVTENLASKQVVAYINFRESGYYGHAIDNILPRLFAVMEGVIQSGHKMILVLPPLGKRSLSENTKVLCQMLGIEVRQHVPIYPHRTMGLSGVASWSRENRQAFQRAIWSSPLLKGTSAAACNDPWISPPWNFSITSGPSCPCRFNAPGLFLGRHATRNSRPVPGAEYLEIAFQNRSFEVIRDAEAVPLQQLAQKIYKSCSFVGFSGTAMVNLIFLPPSAAVADVNPYDIYANSWLWSHALNYCFCQVQPPRNLDQKEASKWASIILDEPTEKYGFFFCYCCVQCSTTFWVGFARIDWQCCINWQVDRPLGSSLRICQVCCCSLLLVVLLKHLHNN